MLLIFFINLMNAQEPTGYEIMKQSLNKTGWQDMQADLELILTNARGETRVRKIVMYSRKRTENESDMLMRFTAPADVRGTSFLVIEHEKGEDERYLYLPALRRIKRIASSGKGGNFMSSDFTYYDIGKPELDDWKYERLEDEKVGDRVCFKISCLPANEQIEKDTGYGKIIRWIDQERLVSLKAVYYDRALREWKTLDIPRVELIGGVWFQTDMIMKDVQTGHQSEMIFKNVKINQNIPAQFFSQRFLQRGK
ncbi:MAG: outer membrane lipoprotein-sorting protein [Calditrichaeota bacterium]|nr:MAG: outer membrane lipoprotein-sorting protein [Calditrichota bacterium]